jgi:DNA-binding transcriptional LysR family regulator
MQCRTGSGVVSRFLAVVETGSMAKAADELAISRPVVSRTISDLEHTLGVRLVDRTPKGVEPTLYGRALLKRSRAVFDELRQGVNEIEALADPDAGELRHQPQRGAWGQGLLWSARRRSHAAA